MYEATLYALCAFAYSTVVSVGRYALCYPTLFFFCSGWFAVTDGMGW